MVPCESNTTDKNEFIKDNETDKEHTKYILISISLEHLSNILNM